MRNAAVAPSRLLIAVYRRRSGRAAAATARIAVVLVVTQLERRQLATRMNAAAATHAQHDARVSRHARDTSRRVALKGRAAADAHKWRAARADERLRRRALR